MKKIFVLSLVLVFALSSAAMAGISFSGEFESKLAVESFDPETADWTFTNTLTLEVAASGEGTGWAFEGELAAPTTDGDDLTGAFELGEYKLTLTDDYFNAWVWGGGAETSDKGTNLGFIEADEEADDPAVRVEVPVMDITTLTVDYRRSGEGHDAVRFFADFNVNDIELGLAGGRYYADGPANTIVASAGTTIDMFTVKGAVGATLGEELGYAAGLDASADVTEEISVGAKVWMSNPGFVADVDPNKVYMSANVEFNDGTIWVEPALTFEGTFDEFAFTSDKQRLDFGYRFDGTVAFGDILDDYEDLTAPALKGFVQRAANVDEAATLSAEVGVAAPIMDDFLWGKVTLGFVGNADGEDYELVNEDDAFVTRQLYAKADAFVTVTDRLTVMPHIGFRNISGEPILVDAAQVVVLPYSKANALVTSVGADYKVGGLDGPTLKVNVSNEAFFGVEDQGKEVELDMVQRASISIEVTF